MGIRHQNHPVDIEVGATISSPRQRKMQEQRPTQSSSNNTGWWANIRRQYSIPEIIGVAIGGYILFGTVPTITIIIMIVGVYRIITGRA